MQKLLKNYMKGLWQMIKINYEQMEYLFTGIEDGWIIPNNEELELYYAYQKWIRKDKIND